MTNLPNLASLRIGDGPGVPLAISKGPNGIEHGTDRYLQKLKDYAKSLPYDIESNSKMQEMLNFIMLRLAQCVEAKDYDPGFLQWDSMLAYWSMLKYPIPKEKRIRIAKIYFHVCTTPGMPNAIIASCADLLKTLLRSTKKLSVEDMRLPWKPLYDVLSRDLFLTRRQFEYSQLAWCIAYIADNTRRFFHPAAIDEMLSTFIPMINGTELDSLISSQYYLLTFLPLSHPQSYLPMLLRLWESINSYIYDERMLQFLARLAEIHVDPSASDPRLIGEIPDDERSEGEGRPIWNRDDLNEEERWYGLYKDVGIFTEHEWSLLMCKCLGSMEIPLADAGSLHTGPSADNQAGFEVSRLPNANWRIGSLARIIVYSIAPDGFPAPASNAPTPLFTPLPSGMNTPQIQTSTLKEFLSAPLLRPGQGKHKTYLAGSKALDSVVRLIASTESFFHPSNSGAWTSDLSAFIKFIVYDFNRRWHEEQLPECKTPKNRRLTRQMKRELVKSLRTVALLAMFSPDPGTVSNIQSCLKSMSVMEPDLILQPVVERAIPALEALVETQRTIAVIKALGAIAPAIVSREVYYPGAKHLISILQLLIPGIDLNDPSKTLCTTSFLIEISQYIKFGDLTKYEEVVYVPPKPKPQTLLAPDMKLLLPKFPTNGFDSDVTHDMEPRLSDREEDKLLRETTASFADWVTSFIRRVIQLLENLPEEGPDGSAGGATEVQVVDAVAGACSQICVHLSDELYDLVLNMFFDYASSNVRSNAVRAIHQLVECIANANPAKTLAKFLPFCSQNIRVEIDNGACSLRTTQSSTPIPSDATLHWNLAILRGSVYNDGKEIVKYRKELLSILRLLHDKAFSKRGYSWNGKLLTSMLLTLTHTYPLENKFVNPDEWNSEEFRKNHHRSWGKLYEPGDIKLSWHIANGEEINFALQVFRELIEPTLSVLDGLIDPGIVRDAVWRNDFCRHLSFVRSAFSGIPTFARKTVSPEALQSAIETSDILNEVPEMIASLEPLNSGFCLTDPRDQRYQYITSLRHRFGVFLHKASVSLRKQGEENTLDAVHSLIRAIRTYMLEYGDSRDSYFTNRDQYSSEINVARQYAGQKVWPRAVYVRRARFYNSARLRWNSLDRIRGPLEDSLIDDVVEWSMWHYATIRETSQSLLENLCVSFDGCRRRALPVLYKSLEPGIDDDRMKGALWTLNSPYFSKFAISAPTLAPELVKRLLSCQHNEKPSIQECVSVVSENCLNSFIEPSFIVYGIENAALDQSVADLKACISYKTAPDQIVLRCREQRIKRHELMNASIKLMTEAIIDTASSSRTHWKYAIFAVRCLRTLVRRDMSLDSSHVRLFFAKVLDNNSTIRYYAQRAVMKSLRYIKLRTHCTDPVDLALMDNHNPLRVTVPIQPSHALTKEFLEKYRVPIDISLVGSKPVFCDRMTQGWLAWKKEVDLFKPPDASMSTFQPWEQGSKQAIDTIRDTVTKPAFWEKLSVHYAEENHETSVAQDNISTVKSIFQLLEDEPFDALKPTLEKLLANTQQDKQRAAAELLAGVLGGSKHWPADKQRQLWEWFSPYIKKLFNQNIKTDTLPIWTSFLEYMFHHKDPRRLQPIVDHIFGEFRSMDYNCESSFDAVKIMSLFRAFYEGLNWKFSAWADDVLQRCWPEIHGEHDDVRAYIGEILAFSGKVMWRPNPSIPTTEFLIKECRSATVEQDIMGLRGTFHLGRILELVDQFNVWRKQRVPGNRAFQSTYDRVGITVCKWLFRSVHDTHAVSTFDYILPLMPELFRFTEVNDNNELASRSNLLLNRMCGVTPPPGMIHPILDAMFEAIQASPSWKVRLKALPLVQVFYFRQVPLISEPKTVEIMEVLCKCLDDEVVEVREMAATTLSGVIRLSPRRSVITLKDRFIRLAKNSHIPHRNSPLYPRAIRQRHAAILGICALVDSFPYTIERWLPELLTTVLAEHTYDPIPISTSVRKCASNFKRTHHDTWHEDSKRFNDHQLAALSTLLTGSSYYA